MESRQISNEEEIGHLRRIIKTSSKFAESFKFELSMYSKFAWIEQTLILVNRNQDLNDKIFSQLSQEVKKTRGLKAFDIWIEGWEDEENLLLIIFSRGEMYDPAMKNLGIGLKPLKRLKYLKVKLIL